MDKKAVRVFYRKTDRAVYISHLDTLRAMQRAIKRAGLPVWYSEGFNPRIYLSFPAALPLGTEGCREPVDMYVTEEISLEEFAARLDKACPPGLGAVSAGTPVYGIKDIGCGEYETEFSGDIPQLVKEFSERETMPVIKHSKKKGETTLDIKPYTVILGAEGNVLRYRLPAGNELNINSCLFTGLFEEFCREKTVNICARSTKRIKIICKDGADFV